MVEDPERILALWVRPGMIVLEPGCGMGYFSLPLARMVGPTGRVICVDLQQKMIDGLARRARKAGLLDRLVPLVCGPDDLGISEWRGRVDLAVAIHVIHEVPDQAALLRQMAEALRPGGRLLFREPRGHVSREQFEATILTAADAGLIPGAREAGRRSWQAVLSKSTASPIV
jgi:ubiquinone/menaquinone biosynthesis C-methylase UbiE